MKKLHLAFSAFVSILFNRNHVFSDNQFHSCCGTRSELLDLINSVIEIANDDIHQSNLLSEAHDILKPLNR